MINFADRPRLDVAMTSDLHAIEAGIGRVDSIGGTALLGSPADFGKFVADETEKWGKVIRAANIKPE